MKALLQRVSEAAVRVDGQLVGEIAQGLLVFVGVEKHDDESSANKLVDKILAYRVFSDQQGKMNNSVKAIGGEVLLVSQFTLAAETNKGLRPGFSSAAEPELAQQLYQHMLARIESLGVGVASGQFAADMQVSLTNDGPVTFLLSA